MPEAQQTIFREKALNHYLQNQEKMVLPRFISPPVILVLWCFLCLFLISGGFAWFYQVPTYLTAIGEVGGKDLTKEAQIVVILPANKLSMVHTGQAVQMQVGENGPQWSEKITMVEPRIMNPSDIRSRFNLDNTVALVVQQPAAIALVSAPSLSVSMYAGSLVQVKIQVGFQRVISLLPWLDNLR